MSALLDTDHVVDVLDYVMNRHARGQACALIIVTEITGGTLRARGAVMAVAQTTPPSNTDHVCGYISSGCVDADIITQAQMCLETGVMRRLCYGEGSPYRDIVLPCGGRIDVAILPRPDMDAIIDMHQALSARGAVDVSLTPSGKIHIGPHDPTGLFTHTYTPKLHLRLVGRGAPLRALAQLAHRTQLSTHIYSPDTDIKIDDVPLTPLLSPDTPPPVRDDAWTAIVFMFHDHDWEPALLAQALAGDAFYIGALGSTRTHAQRCERLKLDGINADDISRIHGPIGVIPFMRDAHFLAVSTLAEIIQTAHHLGRL